jgi:hypothetical protein
MKIDADVERQERRLDFETTAGFKEPPSLAEEFGPTVKKRKG